MRDDPSAAFWRFSLTLYARPGVANALIGLQDRLGLDVNLVLYCLWRAMSGRATTRAEILAATRSSRAWQAGIVRRLRMIRRALKVKRAAIEDRAIAAAAARLREAVKKLEIESERIEQRVLSAAVRAPGTAIPPRAAATAARANLRHYLSILRLRAAAVDRAALDDVIAAASAIKIKSDQ